MGKIKKRGKKSCFRSGIFNKKVSLRQISKIECCFTDDNLSPQKYESMEDEFPNISLNAFKSAVAKVSSHYSEDRVSALKILTALPMNKKNLKKFRDYNCIDTVSQLMTDTCTQFLATLFISKLLQAHSFTISESKVKNILRNLSPMLKLFNGESLSLSRKKVFSGEESQSQTESFITGVHILSKLSELNQSAIYKMNDEGLIPFLFKFANPNQFGYSITLDVLQCLLCLTEGNEAAAECLSTDHLLSLISCQTENYHQVYFAVLVAGILVNISSSEKNIVNAVFKIISHTVNINILSVCDICSESGDPEMSVQLNSLLSAQKLALEIVANICYINGLKDDEDYDMDDECSDNDLFVVEKALLEYKLVETVLVKATLSYNNLSNIDDKQKHLFKIIKSIKIRAVLCLINISGFINCNDTSGSEILYNIFSHLGSSLLTADIEDEALLKELSAAMRTVVENLCTGDCRLLCNVSVDELQSILKMASNSSMKIDLSHVLGSVCCFLIENIPEKELYGEKQLEFLISLTTHLLQIASESSELWECAEGLDIIIDVFSHDKTDRLAAQQNLVMSLRKIQGQFMAQFKRQRRRQGEHWPIIETVKDNLLNFIEHKSKRIANSSQFLS